MEWIYAIFILIIGCSTAAMIGWHFGRHFWAMPLGGLCGGLTFLSAAAVAGLL